jgi:signal transduction histidine kinase/ligand-binding sensor domain-containing protein
MREDGFRRARALARATRDLGVATTIALLLASRAASAQTINFRDYTSAEGLPASQVLAIHQDHLGYIWFATYGGLSRFNGKEFRTFSKEDGLSSNAVWDVTEDGKGRLLLATSRGLCIRDQGRFTCYRQADGLVDDNARTLAFDRAGGVWVGTHRGLSYVSGGKFKNYTTTEGLPSERVTRVAVDSSDRVWVATDKGLARLEGDRFVQESRELTADTVVQFVAPAGKGVLVGASHHLFVRDGSASTEIGGIPDSTIFVDGAVDRDGTMWIVTRTGALRIRSGHVDQINEDNGLLTPLVNRVAIDREGDVWFATENGASKHVPGPFRTYTMREGLPSDFVRAIAVDAEGRLWTGGRNGVAVHEGERFRAIPLGPLPDNRVYSLSRAPNGGMLIGTRRGLVWWKDGKVTQFHTADGLPGEVIYSLVPDGRGGVWIGTERGLGIWQNGKIVSANRPELSRSSLISMTRDSRGRLWMGRTAAGIAILDGDSLRVLGPAEGATDQTVWALREDRQGRMWAATNGDGALRIDDKGIRRFTTKDGLASNFLWQVLADSRGDIWLFGNQGLDRFSGDYLAHYGRGAGLIELEGSATAAFEDDESNLWFGTGSGVVRYTPGLDVRPAMAPPVYIEEATRNGEPFAADSSKSLPRFLRGDVRFTFSAPSFRDESTIRFRYRLVGASDSWSAPTSERSVTYARLRPGRYRFEVMAMNGAVESTSGAAVDFDVLPRFWQTWWFALTGLLVLLGAAAVVPLLRARGLEKERRRLEGLVARHTRELADKNARLEQSNRDLEHFAYVASHDLQEPLRKIQAFSDRVTKGYADRLDDQGRDYLGRMGSAAARMQRLIDDLLSLSRVTTKKNPIEPIELRELAQEVLGDLEFRIQSTHGRVELGELPLLHGDPVQIRQVFQNLIGNALKFHRPGEPPVVRVTAVQSASDPSFVEIHFEDNGIGFETKDAERVFLPFQRLHGRVQYEGTGIGLTIVQKIAERHGGTIRAESAPGKGSTFVLTLPVSGPMGEQQREAA